MNYRIWESYGPGSGFAFVEDFTGWTDKQEELVFFGKPIKGRLPHLTVTRLRKGRLPDALGTVLYYSFISIKLRNQLENLAKDVLQFLPVHLPSYPDTYYFLPNVISHVSCLDRTRSIYKAFPDPPNAIYYLRKMVLLPIPVESPPIFHMSEIPAVLLVRDDLRKQLQRVASSPGKFINVQKFTIGIL